MTTKTAISLGYWFVAFAFIATVLVTTRGIRRTPANRQLATSFAWASVSLAILAPHSQTTLEDALGGAYQLPHAVANLISVVAIYHLRRMVSLYLDPDGEGPRQVLVQRVVLAVTVISMGVLFALADVGPGVFNDYQDTWQIAAFSLVLVLYLGVTIAQVGWLYLRYAPLCTQPLRAGLQIAVGGTVLNELAILSRIYYILASLLDLPNSAAFDSVGVSLLALLGFFLQIGGVTLPRSVDLVRRLARIPRYRREHRQLQPLRDLAVETFPQVRQPVSRRRSVASRRYGSWLEIRDAELLARHYRPEHVRADIEATAEETRLSPGEIRAAVEAGVLVAAMMSKQLGRDELPEAERAHPISSAGDAFDDDVSWLVAVTRAIHEQPVVDQGVQRWISRVPNS